MTALQGSTTVRVSRRTHKVLGELAAQEGRSVADLLDRLAERARRDAILAQSAAAMERIMTDPEERKLYIAELAVSEEIADEVVEREPLYDDPRLR
jgi:hypothetical protein